jgi:hypothetical protein
MVGPVTNDMIEAVTNNEIEVVIASDQRESGNLKY